MPLSTAVNVVIAVSVAFIATNGSPNDAEPESPEGVYIPGAAARRLPAGVPVAVIGLGDGSTVELLLLEDRAPLTVAHFTALADRHFYDGTVWNRVVPGFVVQGGAPAAVGRRNDPPMPEPEPNEELCSRGAVCLARKVIPEGAGGYRYAETLGDQFCILLGDALYLNDDFTVFATVPSGTDILDAVEEGDPIVSVTVVRVPAYGD